MSSRGERGSAVIEGVAALGIAFLLLVLVVQIGVAMAAREAAQGAVAAAARRAARPGADLAAESATLTRMLERSVPGARRIAVNVRHHGSTAVASARIRLVPPGPDWLPVEIRVDARISLVVPP